MCVQHRRKYDPDFNRNAVSLSEEQGRKEYCYFKQR
jgi:hypothetical protein